jgi:hypothetical protein
LGCSNGNSCRRQTENDHSSKASYDLVHGFFQATSSLKQILEVSAVGAVRQSAARSGLRG